MLTDENIKQFAIDWYKKLDVHAPMVELLPMLADEELEMIFPEGTFYQWKGFEQWYQNVIRVFFNEAHTLKSIKPSIQGDTASARVIVYWNASTWNAPDAKAKQIEMDAYQTWELKALDEKILLTKYVVDDIKYYEGSAKL